MGQSQTTTSSRNEDLQTALGILLLRDDDPEPHPDGKSRMGNVLNMARWAGCSSESMHSVRDAVQRKGYEIGSVDDEVIREVCNFFKSSPSCIPDVTNEELQAMIDLATAAGLKPEAELLSEIFDLQPFQSQPSSA